MKRNVFYASLIFTMITLFVFSVSFAKEFPDMPSSHWAYKYVEALTNSGVVNGYEDGTFKPSKNVTRAEFIKLITSCISEDAYKEDFGDDISMLTKRLVNWYDKYIVIASLYDLLPYEYTSDVNVEASRSDMVDVLYRYGEKFNLFSDVKIERNVIEKKDVVEIAYELKLIKKKNMSLEEFKKEAKKFTEEQKALLEEEYEKATIYADTYNLKEVNNYKDLEGLDNYSLYKIECLIKSGLLKGYEDNTFRLGNSLTRAETSTIIYRILNAKGE